MNVNHVCFEQLLKLSFKRVSSLRTITGAVLGYLLPLDVVLRLFSDEVDSLQNIGDIVDASFLDVQVLGRFVEVQYAIWCRA